MKKHQMAYQIFIILIKHLQMGLNQSIKSLSKSLNDKVSIKNLSKGIRSIIMLCFEGSTPMSDISSVFMSFSKTKGIYE